MALVYELPRPFTRLGAPPFVCVCVCVSQVKTKVIFFVFLAITKRNLWNKKLTEQVNFMVIINFMVSLKNIEELEQEQLRKKWKRNSTILGYESGRGRGALFSEFSSMAPLSESCHDSESWGKFLYIFCVRL